jgi:hypothetical protein
MLNGTGTTRTPVPNATPLTLPSAMGDAVGSALCRPFAFSFSAPSGSEPCRSRMVGRRPRRADYQPRSLGRIRVLDGHRPPALFSRQIQRRRLIARAVHRHHHGIDPGRDPGRVRVRPGRRKVEAVVSSRCPEQPSSGEDQPLASRSRAAEGPGTAAFPSHTGSAALAAHLVRRWEHQSTALAGRSGARCHRHAGRSRGRTPYRSRCLRRTPRPL